MSEFLIQSFVKLLVVVNPFSAVPIFVTLTQQYAPEMRRRIAQKACLISLVLLLFFALFGGKLIALMRISPEAFRMTGGLLLMLAAIEMVIGGQIKAKESCADAKNDIANKEDICVFPLSIPLMAGPGALTLTVLLMNESITVGGYAPLGIIFLLFIVMVIAITSLLLGGRLMGVFGMTGTNVLTRVFGIILCAVAIDNIIKGVVSVMRLSHCTQ